MKISPIKFKNFETKGIYEFDAFADRYIGYNLLILVATKNEEFEEWHYGYELLLWDDLAHVWQNDWYEGQEYVEYLGAAVLDYYENEEIL